MVVEIILDAENIFGGNQLSGEKFHSSNKFIKLNQNHSNVDAEKLSMLCNFFWTNQKDLSSIIHLANYFVDHMGILTKLLVIFGACRYSVYLACNFVDHRGT